MLVQTVNIWINIKAHFFNNSVFKKCNSPLFMSYHFREMYLVIKVCFPLALFNNEMIIESRNSLKSDVSKLLKDGTLMMLLPSQSDKQSLNVIP